jgi:DNA polymerase III subunit epsilon
MSLLDFFKTSAAPLQQERQRCVVLDVETSGLDVDRAQLLAVAAIAVEIDWTGQHLHICPGDSVEMTFKPEQLVEDVDNILIHGIGQQRQQTGLPLWQGLPLLQKFVQDAPLLAFHAWFDKGMLSRHWAALSTEAWPNAWLDIEKLCSVLHPSLALEGLDEWLSHYSISCAARHEAAADCLAECELLQRIWPLVSKEVRDFKGLQKLERLDQWLSR